MLSERPEVVHSRVHAGHWEGDYIVGAGNRTAIGTLVERTMRQLVLVHLGRDRSRLRCVMRWLESSPHCPHLRRSLTWDQGKEMAGHLELTQATGIPVFLCQAHSPWQRGSNENMNGLVRDYFPKHSDLSGHSANGLADAMMAALSRDVDLHIPQQLFLQMRSAFPPDLPDWIKIT